MNPLLDRFGTHANCPHGIHKGSYCSVCRVTEAKAELDGCLHDEELRADVENFANCQPHTELNACLHRVRCAEILRLREVEKVLRAGLDGIAEMSLTDRFGSVMANALRRDREREEETRREFFARAAYRFRIGTRAKLRMFFQKTRIQ